jgi:hypothetical protein
MRMAVDTPKGRSVARQPFTVTGWALDLAAPEGAGVDTVHVWAYPTAGGAPIFVGVASIGDPRPDVAATYGSQFERSAYRVVASGLASGTYDVVVYALRAATNAFEAAHQVRVIIR